MTLLRLDPEGIEKLLENYEKIVDEIKKSAMSMAWYMRGGATYEDILNMSSTEREFLKELIDSNLETTKKSGLPFF
jgi:predicted nucleic-acid-binding protein